MCTMLIHRAVSGLASVAILAALASSGSALAHHTPDHIITAEAQQGQDHSGHDMGAKPAAATADLSPASKAYETAMQKMHQNMMVPYANDVDLDFVRGMIPHHQGAIDQAEVLLKYSKNLRLRRLAGGIIASQKREIRFMQNWLKEHDTGVETGEMPEWMKSAPDTEADANKRGESDK